MLQIGIDPTVVDSSPKFNLGQLGTSDNSSKVYKYVKLRNETATVAGAAGDVDAYLASPASEEEQNTVVLDNSDAATKPVGAGVLQATVTGAQNTAEYIWVQVSGYATANATLAGSPADGDALFLSTTD